MLVLARIRRWLIGCRWVMLGLMMLLAFVEHGPWPGYGPLLAVLALGSLLQWGLHVGWERAPTPLSQQRVLGAILTLDFLIVAAACWLERGLESPFFFFLFVPVASAALEWPCQQVLLVVVLATTLCAASTLRHENLFLADPGNAVLRLAFFPALALGLIPLVRRLRETAAVAEVQDKVWERLAGVEIEDRVFERASELAQRLTGGETAGFVLYRRLEISPLYVLGRKEWSKTHREAILRLAQKAKPGEPFFTGNLQRDRRLRGEEVPFGGSWVSLFVDLRDGKHGVLFVHHSQPSSLPPWSPFLLEPVGRALTTQLQHARRLEAVRRAVEQDALTGLYAREAFLRYFQQEINRSRRYGHPLTLVLMAIRHLDLYNRVHSYEEGDQLIKAVVKTLLPLTRETDLLGRWSGNRLAVVMLETSVEDWHIPVQRWREAVRRELRWKRPPAPGLEPPSVDLVVGYAGFPEDGEVPTQLLDKAEERLQEAMEKEEVPIVPLAPPQPAAALAEEGKPPPPEPAPEPSFSSGALPPLKERLRLLKGRLAAAKERKEP